MKPDNGFTLIELLVTIAAAAILMAVAVPSFNDLIVSSRLSTQTNDLIAAINTARSEAIKRNRNTSFCRAASATATSCVSSSGTWEHWIVVSGGIVLRRGTINRYGNTMNVTSTLTNDTVVLTSEGLARTSGGALIANPTITICASNGPTNNNRRITLGAGSRLSTSALAGACS